MIKYKQYQQIALYATLVIIGVFIGLISREKTEIKTEKIVPKTQEQRVSHKNSDCESNAMQEYSLSQKEKYELVVLCAGYVIPTDVAVVIDTDQIFLKDKETGKYYGFIAYESALKSSYKILAVSYPRVFVAECFEGCSAPSMIELNGGPNDPFRYFDIRDIFYRNQIGDSLDVVGGKVIVAGMQKIAEFDPVTFSVKTVYEVNENQTIGYSSGLPSFQSSIKKMDNNHIEFKVYSDKNRYTEDENGNNFIPKEDYTKVIEIK